MIDEVVEGDPTTLHEAMHRGKTVNLRNLEQRRCSDPITGSHLSGKSSSDECGTMEEDNHDGGNDDEKKDNSKGGGDNVITTTDTNTLGHYDIRKIQRFL